MTKIIGDMNISDVLNIDAQTAQIFFANGLHCLGCPSAAGESIFEACQIHGIDSENLLKELNDYFANKASE
jgi:hybrid cluster-associated redox disulfide protein